MKINIFYEKKNIEFYSKILLASKLVQNKSVDEVKLGFYKSMILNFLKNLQTKDHIINIYKDFWVNTEIFTELSNLFSQDYFTIHEEEYLVYHSSIIENYKKNKYFISNHHLENLNGIFGLSNESKKIYKSKVNIDFKKYFCTGNLRYFFMNLVKKKGHFKNNDNIKHILFSLSSPLFVLQKQLFKQKIKINESLLKDKNFDGLDYLDRYALYKYTRRNLKLFLKFLKLNPNLNILIRPHPNDQKFLKYYKLVFKKYKNVKIDMHNDIFYCLNKCNLVFSSPDNVALESLMMGKETNVYYDKNDYLHNYIFADHPFVNLFSERIFKNSIQMNEIFENTFEKKDFNDENLQKLNDMYGTNQNTLNEINKIILDTKNKKKENKNKLVKELVVLSLKKIIKYIENDKKNNNYGIEYFEKFRKKFKFSFSRILFLLIFKKNSSRLSILNNIYKFCLGRDIDTVSLDEHTGRSHAYNEKEIEECLRFYEMKIPEINIDHENKIITFRKKYV